MLVGLLRPVSGYNALYSPLMQCFWSCKTLFMCLPRFDAVSFESFSILNASTTELSADATRMLLTVTPPEDLCWTASAKAS